MQFAYNMALVAGSTFILKEITRMPRPDYKRGDGKKSFPSGHTSIAFFGANFIHFRYGFKKAILPYMLAGFVGYSRIYAKKHYFRDVLCGALLSTFVSYILVTKYENKIIISADTNSFYISYKIDF